MDGSRDLNLRIYVIISEIIYFLQGRDESAGNIHTGATPPWLREDDTQSRVSDVIGPTQQEYKQYRKNKTKEFLLLHLVEFKLFCFYDTI